MAMKGYSAFPKAPALLEAHHQIVKCYTQDTCFWVGGSYPSAEKGLLYSTAPADWAIIREDLIESCKIINGISNYGRHFKNIFLDFFCKKSNLFWEQIA